MTSFQRLTAMAFLGLALTGCASSGSYDSYQPAPETRAPQMASALPPTPGRSRVETVPGQTALQCVPYARDHSAIKIYGDAWTWWDQAAGKYERGSSPAGGAVLVLHNYAGANHGHVAVVRRIVSAREIRVDHANWLNNGSIYVNNPVVDVSPANDWSQVRIFNIPAGGWGTKVYPVKGFIGSGSGGTSAPQRNAPPAYDDTDDAPVDRPLPPDTEALIAAILKSAPAPVRTAAAAPPRTPPTQTSSVRDDDGRNPPAGSRFALTAQDLEIP